MLSVLLVATLSFSFVQKRESYQASDEKKDILQAQAISPSSGELIFTNAGGIVCQVIIIKPSD